MSEVSSVTSAEWDVWRSFHTMRRQLDLALERELQQDAKISMPDFEVLLALFEATDNQLRARELGVLISWEKSRLSHQVTRMEARGLVERTDCDTDARGTWIGITQKGRLTILRAMRDHALTIRRLFFDVMTEDELGMLREMSGRVLTAIEPPDCEMLAGSESGETVDRAPHDREAAGAA
jgi:DNA-binding MarR family transcriptional regulator